MSQKLSTKRDEESQPRHLGLGDSVDWLRSISGIAECSAARHNIPNDPTLKSNSGSED
jgi:hypothetical protein